MRDLAQRENTGSGGKGSSSKRPTFTERSMW